MHASALLTANATAFVDRMIAEGRVYPANRHRFIELHVEAAVDDLADPTPIRLVEAGHRSRRVMHVATFEADVRKLPCQSSTTMANTPMTAERRKNLLSNTTLGRQIVIKEAKSEPSRISRERHRQIFGHERYFRAGN